MLYNPAYVHLVEQSRSLVAMDDLDPGSQYFCQSVDNCLSTLLYALAKGHLSRPAYPQMLRRDRQTKQVMNWVKEHQIDDVLEMPEIYSVPRQFGVRFCVPDWRRLASTTLAFGMPRFHDMSNAGQLRTRIEAFAEMFQAIA
jgi:benzoyl-CoA reductase/2-hydroxyglutaryl-CoA dehydratase subunit BcrC/BadD/HgdB